MDPVALLRHGGRTVGPLTVGFFGFYVLENLATVKPPFHDFTGWCGALALGGGVVAAVVAAFRLALQPMNARAPRNTRRKGASP